MPETCDSQTIKTQAACIWPCVSKIELLASIACSLRLLNNMSCSAADIKSQAACIWPCVSEIELLASIACSLQTLSTGTVFAKQVFEGDGPPVGLQTGQDATIAATYYDRSEGFLAYAWDPNTQLWN